MACCSAHAALRVTTRLHAATSVLVAFPRSPMLVAIAAWDLAAMSGGRFELGLGTQVRGNIERRYSTPWTAPVARMREYVRALRAIFAAFQHGAPLAFEGEHYRFTRLQPFFNPGPIAHPEIPIFLGAVGPKMSELAGEVADGLMTHPTNSSPRYLREATRPRSPPARSARAATRTAIELLAGGFIATGRDAAAVAREREHARELLTFLYSTPAYWPTLDLFGWRDVGERLHRLTREGKWGEMAGAVSDEMLDALVPQAPYAEIAAVLKSWYGGLATRINFPLPSDPADDAARRARDRGAEGVASVRTFSRAAVSTHHELNRVSTICESSHPCLADWAAMQERGPGRFCSQCERTVHDTTKMSRRQIERLVASKRDRHLSSVCCRLPDGTPPHPRPPARCPGRARRRAKAFLSGLARILLRWSLPHAVRLEAPEQQRAEPAASPATPELAHRGARDGSSVTAAATSPIDEPAAE